MRKHYPKFRGMTSAFRKKQNGGRLRNSIGFRKVLTFFMLFSAILSMESFKKCKNNVNDHTCLFHCITLAVSLGSSLSPRPGGLGFKQLPRATANVSA